MDCTACGHSISEEAKFCSQCGSPVMRGCASCGHDLAPNARFCEQCGSAVQQSGSSSTAVDASGDSAVRKTVTVLFADLVGSTAFGERVDAESTREVLADYHSMARSVIEEHGGFLAKFIGDGVMALFGVPETAEDDAIRAIAAGVALQSGFEPLRDLVAQRHGPELGLRVGVNTGEVVIAEGDADVVGDALNTAARLEAACSPGHVLVGEDTWRLTRSAVEFEELGRVEVKGKAVPVATYQVLAAAPDDDDSGTPFVGRVGELSRLREVFDAAVAGRTARLATVVGAPGVGKTRLSRELCLGVDDVATVIEMRCRRSGIATFAPVADLLRSSAGLDEHHSPDETRTAVRRLVDGLSDADRVADLLTSFVGVGSDRSTEEAFFAVRRLFESQARRQPVVIVVDDIQWAEPLFLDLLEHLAEWVDDAPMLVLALARPEIREIRPSLATEGRLVQAAIALEGLDADATAELAARLVGAAELPAELIGRLPQSTEGNPLFVRELMRMLVDDGVIVASGPAWELTIEADAVEVPPTIQSLLSARLDRMSPDERRLVELASVVGSEFPLGAVHAVSEPGTSMHSLRGAMDRLRRRELVESAGRYRGDEPVFRFHHVLIRDAAYRRLLKRRRADLHMRIGEWTERTAVDLPGEHEAPIAFHFEQAFAYRRELSDPEEEAADLGRRAAGLLRIAAERALDRDDIAAAGALVERAVACLDAGAPELSDLLMLGCEALLSLGDVPRSRSLVAALAELGGDDRQAAWTSCFEAQLTVLTEPGALHDVLRRLDSAADRLAGWDDDAGVAKARLVRAGALARLGRIGESESELDLALTAARAADDRRRVAAVLGVAPVAALWGPSPIPRAGGRCLDVIRLLRITTGSPSVEAVSTRCQAVLEALRGRFDTARTMLAEARATVEELGLRHEVLETQMYAGIVELLADEPADAEPPLRDAYKGLADLGIDADAGQAAAYLARALLRLGRVDEADELAGASDALAGQTPQTGIVARAVQAEVLAARGNPDEAVQIAREAVEIASATDLVIDHADATTVLAAVATDPNESTAARDAATTLYESKAATLRPALAVPSAPPPSDAIEQQSDPMSQGRTADEVAASARPDELIGAPAPGSDEAWNRADAWCRQGWARFTSHDQAGWRGHLSDDIALDDRRSLIGGESTGWETLIERMWAISDAAIKDSRLTTIATRGERLVLQRHGLRTDDGTSWEFLAVYLLGDDGRVARMTVFDGHDVESAVDELDRLFLDDPDNPLEALAVRRAAAVHRAFRAGDVEALESMSRHSPHRTDHSPLGWGAMGSAGMDERRKSLFDLDVDFLLFLARMYWVDPHCLCFGVHRITWPADGSEYESTMLVVEDVDKSTDENVGHMFDGAQVSEAIATARARSDSFNEPANAASAIFGALHMWHRLGRPTVHEPPLADDFVAIDHAPDGGVVGSTDVLGDDAPVWLGASRRVLLAYGDEASLVELGAAQPPEERRFALEWINRRGELQGLTLFPHTTAGLAAAGREIAANSGWAEEVPDVIRQVAEVGVEVERLAELLSPDFLFADRRILGYPRADRDAYLEMAAAIGHTERGVTLPIGLLAGNQGGVVGTAHEFSVRDDGQLVDSGRSVFVTVVGDDGVSVIERFPADAGVDAIARFEELTRDHHSGFDNLARRVGRRMITAMNDGVLGDRVDELFVPGWVRVDHRTVVNTGTLDAETVAESTMSIEAHGTTTPIANRGDHFTLSRGVTSYGPQTESAYLVLSEVDRSARQTRVDFYDEDARDDAMAELDRRWVQSLSPEEQHTVAVTARWRRAAMSWDVAAFDELMSDDFEGYDHTRLGAGPMTRARFLSSQRARGELQGSGHNSLIDLAEMPRRNVVLSRLRSSGRGEVHGAEWENQWIVVQQAVDGRIRRFGLFDFDDLDEARTWAASLDAPAQIDPLFDNLAMRATMRFETAVNDGTLSEHLDEWYEPDFERIDRRTVIGTGTLDRNAYVESIPDFFDSIAHVPVAVRGERFLLARSTMQYEGGSESELLVLVEMSEAGRERRTILFDRDALDEAIAELDRRWARTLIREERETLKVSTEYVRAWIEQDYDAFEGIVDPDFRNVEHILFGNEEADLDAMRTAHADADSVFGRREIIVDHIELPTPDLVLARHSSRGTSPTDVDWEVSEWSILQVRDGRVLRNEVFEEVSEHEAESHARRRVEDLVGRADRSDVANRAVRVAEEVFSAWTSGDVAADRFAAGFERLDRRAVVSAPDVGRTELLSTVLPEILALRPHCEVREVLLAYDDALALVRARMANDDGTYEVEYLMAEACDDDGRLVRTAVFDLEQEIEARRELTQWWARTLSPRRVEVSQLAVAFGTSWVAPSTHPFDGLLAPEFTLVDGRTLGLGDLDRDDFVQALVGREDDGTTGPPIPSRVEFVSDDVLLFRAANRGITQGTEIEWEEIACNIFIARGDTIRRLEMFDEDQWDAAAARAHRLVEEERHAGPSSADVDAR